MCPNCDRSTPISAIRGDDRRPKRGQGHSALGTTTTSCPVQGDMFGERLYCVRWRLPASSTRSCRPNNSAIWRPYLTGAVWRGAIAALTDLLEPEQRREVARLRKRDWLEEERAVEAAQLAYWTTLSILGSNHEKLSEAKAASCADWKKMVADRVESRQRAGGIAARDALPTGRGSGSAS